MAVSFDLFGTLVEVTRPSDPAAAVADELRERGVAVPPDFGDAYREMHVDAPGRERRRDVRRQGHLGAVRGVDAPNNAARRAVVAAFDPEVDRRSGALDAIAAAREHGPVGVCSSCSVPELARRTLIRADLRDAFDCVVTSVACGWRKPDARAFETVARRLGVPVAWLVHVGDDPATDGGIVDTGGRFVDIDDTPLSALGTALEEPP